MSYSSEVLVDSPTAYWRLDETSGTTITDSVSSVVLTAAGTPTFSSPSPTGTGIDFGGNSYFDMSTPGAAFVWTLGTDFTIEFMYRRTSIDATTRGLVACRTSTVADRQFGVFHSLGSQLLFDVGGTNNRWSTGVNISDLYWHHIVFKHRGSDGRREFWLDGGLKDFTTAQIPTTADATAGTLVIGSGNGTNPVLGCLDEVAIYNGKYLSTARIQAHWLEIVNGSTKNFMKAAY